MLNLTGDEEFLEEIIFYLSFDIFHLPFLMERGHWRRGAFQTKCEMKDVK